jgi:hypothetical protein
MDKNEVLRYGYFKDFSDPTLLFAGNRNTLEALLDALLSLSVRRFMEISSDPRFRSFAGECLTICLTEKSEGIKHQTHFTPDCFMWGLSGDQVLLFAQRIKSVIDSPNPCHCYLDTDTLDDVLVIVSKNEYPDEWIGNNSKPA